MSGLLEGGFLDEGEAELGPIFFLYLQARNQPLLCICEFLTLKKKMDSKHYDLAH